MKRLGIDIGSTTVKVAVIDEQHNILFSDYLKDLPEAQKEIICHQFAGALYLLMIPNFPAHLLYI